MSLDIQFLMPNQKEIDTTDLIVTIWLPFLVAFRLKQNERGE